MKNTLLLFTTSFPYGKVEQFIETEIHFLSEVFEEIHIIPESCQGEARPVPSNVKVLEFKPAPLQGARSFILKHAWDLFRIYGGEFMNSVSRWKYVTRAQKSFNVLVDRYHKALELEKFLAPYDLKRTAIYSYWFRNWASYLSIIKWRKQLNINFFTRILGYDFDVKQNPQGYFPFRSFEMGQVDSIYPITNYGKRYIQRHYPWYKGKLQVSHLSVWDQGVNELVEKDYFQICSCSYLVALKRVELIPEILQHLKFKVVWTHFGDGPEEEKIKARAAQLPSNISFDYKGYTANKDVIKFYEENSADMFIHLSEMEGGAPVAIQEACSFGVPAIGADADGTPEIVNEQTGYLIPKDFDPQAVAEIIRAYHEDKEDKEEFRKGVKAYWASEFDAAKVYKEFAHEIAGIPLESANLISQA